MKSHGWHELDGAAMSQVVGNPVRAFVKGGCRVLVGHEDRHGNGKLLWHLSISRADRYPGWDEIKDARYSLLPLGLTFAMLLPPPSEYVNVHPNTFHLWEYHDGPTIL